MSRLYPVSPTNQMVLSKQDACIHLNCDSVSTFKSRLKTHLLSTVFC